MYRLIDIITNAESLYTVIIASLTYLAYERIIHKDNALHSTATITNFHHWENVNQAARAFFVDLL
jgi:hypothetical protein